MVAHDIILVEIVVQGKADIRYRTIGGKTFKSCPFNALQGECFQADMGVIPNIGRIIKNERAIQGV